MLIFLFSSLSSDTFRFRYFESLLLEIFTFGNICLPWELNLYSLWIFFLSLCLFALKSTLSNINVSLWAFLCTQFALYVFSNLLLSVCLCPYISCTSQLHIAGYLFTLSDSLCLFMGIYYILVNYLYSFCKSTILLFVLLFPKCFLFVFCFTSLFVFSPSSWAIYLFLVFHDNPAIAVKLQLLVLCF